MPKIVPESIQTFFERVLGQIFRKFFCSVFRGGSSFRKISIFFFKIPKMPKSVPKSIQTCFEHVLWKIFRKIFAQFSMECRVFENFQNFFFSKLQKCPKVFPKESKRVLVGFSRKKFMPSVPWRVEFSKIFNFFFKIPKLPKIVPKTIQTCFERVLRQTFRKFFAQFSTAFRILENFQKNQKNFQNYKNAQNRSQRNPNVF